MSRSGGINLGSASSSRLLEDVVKSGKYLFKFSVWTLYLLIVNYSEDAVEFKDDDLISQELVERLALARRSVSSAAANQENLRDGTDEGHPGQSDWTSCSV